MQVALMNANPVLRMGSARVDNTLGVATATTAISDTNAGRVDQHKPRITNGILSCRRYSRCGDGNAHHLCYQRSIAFTKNNSALHTEVLRAHEKPVRGMQSEPCKRRIAYTNAHKNS